MYKFSTISHCGVIFPFPPGNKNFAPKAFATKLVENIDCRHRGALAAAVTACPLPLVLVANEVGFGIVPKNPLARRFRDEAGRLNQRLAAVADEVVLVAAGLPLVLKAPGTGPAGRMS